MEPSELTVLLNIENRLGNIEGRLEVLVTQGRARMDNVERRVDRLESSKNKVMSAMGVGVISSLATALYTLIRQYLHWGGP